MTDWRAMKELAESAHSVRALARYLIKLGETDPAISWTDWELDFLESMASRESEEPLTMRQREVLVELRAMTERYEKVEGFSVRNLVESCWSFAADLDDDEDQQFIADLRQSGRRSLTRRQVGRLLRCCRDLGVIEPHHGFIQLASGR